ncbi:hypothetical protein LC613_43015, partial [Nostoc sphaeroides CHAB 2801]|uniref:hypothetical protein n=1 Tax=Nostoc sphaeroides TaxID=446679 RepID=UPI001E54B8BA
MTVAFLSSPRTSLLLIHFNKLETETDPVDQTLKYLLGTKRQCQLLTSNAALLPCLIRRVVSPNRH